MGVRNLGRVVGENGITPTVGDNGNWFYNGVDSGFPSRGEQGPQGEQGPVGPQGVPGERGSQGIPGDSNRGVANGVASLDANVLVPRSQLPLAAVGTSSTNSVGDGGRGAVKISVVGDTAYIWTV